MTIDKKIPTSDEVKLGFQVKILKQATDEEHVGIVDLVISEKDHPKGIFVKLKDGVKGRVQEVLENEVQEKDSEYVVEPESTRVEYKQHYVYFNPNSIVPEYINPFKVFKAIASFANGEGGKLIIGIHDDGRILGLQKDYDELQRLHDEKKIVGGSNQDRMELKIKSDAGFYFHNQTKFALDLFGNNIKFIKIGNKEICEITVSPTFDNPLIMYEWRHNLLPEPKLYQLKNGIKKASNINDFRIYERKKMMMANYFVRKGNSSERYDEKEFMEYWVRRMKISNRS